MRVPIYEIVLQCETRVGRLLRAVKRHQNLKNMLARRGHMKITLKSMGFSKVTNNYVYRLYTQTYSKTLNFFISPAHASLTRFCVTAKASKMKKLVLTSPKSSAC